MASTENDSQAELLLVALRPGCDLVQMRTVTSCRRRDTRDWRADAAVRPTVSLAVRSRQRVTAVLLEARTLDRPGRADLPGDDRTGKGPSSSALRCGRPTASGIAGWRYRVRRPATATRGPYCPGRPENAARTPGLRRSRPNHVPALSHPARGRTRAADWCRGSSVGTVRGPTGSRPVWSSACPARTPGSDASWRSESLTRDPPARLLSGGAAEGQDATDCACTRPRRRRAEAHGQDPRAPDPKARVPDPVPVAGSTPC